MAQFKKSRTLKGMFKNVVIHEGMLMDEGTGEAVDFIKILHEVYGENPFDITTSLKTDEDIDIQNY